MTRPEQSESTVLMAVDNGFAAANALPVGRTLARQLGARLVALLVSPTPLAALDARERLGLDTDERQDVGVIVRVGNPAVQIVAAAHENGIRLLIIVARSIDSSAMIGSVTLSVINGSQIPIVLVRPDPALRSKLALRPIHNLLLPIDGSPTTARALRSVTVLAKDLEARLDLLYVAGAGADGGERGSLSAPRYVDQPHHEWPNWSAEVVDRLCRCLARCPEDVTVDMYLASGDPGTEVPRFASEHDVDAVVLVRRSQLGVGRAKTLLSIFEGIPGPISIVVTPYRRDTPAAANARATAGSR